MIPYDPQMIGALLRTMPADRLNAADPAAFQRWPAATVTPATIIKDLIDNERARRRHHGQ